jgi:hypothetical protein
MRLFPSRCDVRRAQLRLLLHFFAAMGILALAWMFLMLVRGLQR